MHTCIQSEQSVRSTWRTATLQFVPNKFLSVVTCYKLTEQITPSTACYLVPNAQNVFWWFQSLCTSFYSTQVYISKYGGNQHNAKCLTQRAKEDPFYKQNSNIKSHVAIFLAIMKSSILTEARVVASYIIYYVVTQLKNVCQKCVIC